MWAWPATSVRRSVLLHVRLIRHLLIRQPGCYKVITVGDNVVTILGEVD